MEEKDRDLLNALQENFPLTERPYQKVGEQIGISEKEVLERTMALMENGTIRRFGILINHKKLDYFSTLLGLKLKDEQLPEIVEIVTKRPEITHCYHRAGEFNLWFTFLTPDKAVFEKFLTSMKQKVGENNILNLPTIKSFKLKTTFKV